jgi:hypothetical protein
MKISIETSSYNQHRYSKPWIALVDFTNPQGDFKFGDWIGDSSNGSSGLLELEASAGDIVARGQKDFRKPRNSAPDWYQVAVDGSLTSLPGKVDALKAFRAKSNPAADNCSQEDVACGDRA